MKKIRIILTILFLFMPFSVFAEVKCKDVVETYNSYTAYENEITSVGCKTSTTLTRNDVNKCNNLSLQSSYELSRLFKYSDNYEECFNDDMNTLIEDKKESCSPLFNDNIKKILKRLLTILFILGPILVIVFGSLDFTKAVVASDQKSMKKAQTNFIKRLAALILLILTPEIVNILINSIDVGEDLSGLSGYSCNYDYINYSEKYQIKTIASVRRTSGGSGGSGSSNSNGITLFKQSDPRWGSQKLFCGSDTIAASGCALTSVAMQIKKAGVKTIISDFNPGTFSAAIRQGKYGECKGNGPMMSWDSYASYITSGKFRMNSNTYLNGNYSDKVNTLTNYINQGYYPVIQVKSSGSHYVAVFYTDNGQLYVGDPANVNDNTIAPLKSNYNLVSQSFSSQVILYEKR